MDRIRTAVIMLNQIIGFDLVPFALRKELIEHLAAALAEAFVAVQTFLFACRTPADILQIAHRNPSFHFRFRQIPAMLAL